MTPGGDPRSPTLGIDVGGTFTDLAWWNGERLVVGKTSTTEDQADGFVDGAGDLLAGTDVDRVLHGTTVATNALLERRGARTVLVTDDGMEDVLAIGRQDRPSLYDSFVDRPDPLVPADRRLAVSGRPTPGDPSVPGDDELTRLAAEVAARSPEAIAVSCLYTYLDDRRESAIAASLADLGVEVTRSSAVVNEFREYERTSTTVINAFLAPEMGRYLGHLAERAAEAGLPAAIRVMRSSGGLMDLDTARRLPVAALLSGPAGGVVATAALGSALGDDHLVAFDMGGTSTDVCRIDGARPEVMYERWIDGLPVRVPTVAVHTVGAGGGSVGWADAGGALRVGPRSAGAMPGPACYGRGGEEPTVTDAHVAMGRIPDDVRLAGSVPLERSLAAAALARLGTLVGLDPMAVAEGIVAIVEAHMGRAIRVVSVEEGADPRRARLVAFGGAGGLHATALARSLDMRGVVIPPFAGVFSAVGLLLAPPRHDAARSVVLAAGDDAGLRTAVGEVAEAAERGLAALGSATSAVRTAVDVRYLGQAHETTVPHRAGAGWAALAQDFHRLHAERNGFSRDDDPIEVVTVRAVAEGRPVLRWSDLPEVRPEGSIDAGTRLVRIGGDEVPVHFVRRAGLGTGDTVTGPAIVLEGQATTLIGPGETGVVHASGAIEVTW